MAPEINDQEVRDMVRLMITLQDAFTSYGADQHVHDWYQAVRESLPDTWAHAERHVAAHPFTSQLRIGGAAVQNTVQLIGNSSTPTWFGLRRVIEAQSNDQINYHWERFKLLGLADTINAEYVRSLDQQLSTVPRRAWSEHSGWNTAAGTPAERTPPPTQQAGSRPATTTGSAGRSAQPATRAGASTGAETQPTRATQNASSGIVRDWSAVPTASAEDREALERELAAAGRGRNPAQPPQTQPTQPENPGDQEAAEEEELDKKQVIARLMKLLMKNAKEIIEIIYWIIYLIYLMRKGAERKLGISATTSDSSRIYQLMLRDARRMLAAADPVTPVTLSFSTVLARGPRSDQGDPVMIEVRRNS
jgi:hypothetical protein